jgi:hypothetical protein
MGAAASSAIVKGIVSLSCFMQTPFSKSDLGHHPERDLSAAAHHPRCSVHSGCVYELKYGAAQVLDLFRPEFSQWI